MMPGQSERRMHGPETRNVPKAGQRLNALPNGQAGDTPDAEMRLSPEQCAIPHIQTSGTSKRRRIHSSDEESSQKNVEYKKQVFAISNILLVYLKRTNHVNQSLYEHCRQTLITCRERHNSGLLGYEDLRRAISRDLRAATGEHTWKFAESHLAEAKAKANAKRCMSSRAA
jgi:hypothetical protein